MKSSLNHNVWRRSIHRAQEHTTLMDFTSVANPLNSPCLAIGASWQSQQMCGLRHQDRTSRKPASVLVPPTRFQPTWACREMQKPLDPVTMNTPATSETKTTALCLIGESTVNYSTYINILQRKLAAIHAHTSQVYYKSHASFLK